MLDILFIFCKLNPDIGYRQGMHELLAPILWVVEKDAIDLGESSKTMGEDALITNILSVDYIEHDAFALFGQVMHSAKNFYEQTTHSGKENPIVRRSQHIFEDLLPDVDKELAQHMRDIEIMPQVFIIRWVRLLFGREFSFDHVLNMWDVIFAEDPSLEIVDYICVVMLLRIRFELMDSDYNMALTLLLRYPQVDREHASQAFVTDALYLRDHAGAEGGGYIVLKYTGRPLPLTGGARTPPALQRNITTFSGVHTTKTISPSRVPGQQRNLEAMLQSTAKNILARGEKLGMGVRNAVDEVHKKALEIRDSQQTASPQLDARKGGSGSSIDIMHTKLVTQERRSQQLSKLLGSAVGELWEYQKLVADGTSNAHDSEIVDKLSLAIARVQFVQVYLEDSSLPLPDDELVASSEDDANLASASGAESARSEAVQAAVAEEAASANTHTTKISAEDTTRLADPSTFEEDFSDPPPAEEKKTPIHSNREPSSDLTIDRLEKEIQPEDPQPPRPPLEQSSFSWMLGQEPVASTSSPSPRPQPTSSPFPSDKKPKSSEKGFLFGDDKPTSETYEATNETQVTPSRKGRRQKHIVTTTESHENVFNL